MIDEIQMIHIFMMYSHNFGPLTVPVSLTCLYPPLDRLGGTGFFLLKFFNKYHKKTSGYF